MQIGIPVSLQSDEERQVWEKMWKATQALLVLHEENLCDRGALNVETERFIKLRLEDVYSFAPIVINRKPVSTRVFNGERFAQAIREEMENMDYLERNAFEEVWSKADRVRFYTPW